MKKSLILLTILLVTCGGSQETISDVAYQEPFISDSIQEMSTSRSMELSTGDYIIKTAYGTIEVSSSNFQNTINEFETLILNYEGSISNTYLSTNYQGLQSYTLTVNIPAEQFDKFISDLEDISELFVTRLSFDNYFQTRRKTYGSRDIMELNFIADFYSKYKNRNLNDSISGQNALWLEFNLNPAPWLKFEMASRLKNKSFNLVENYQKLTLKSSLFWEFGLRSYFKETYTNQVVMDFLYKMSENTHLKTILWADLKNNNIPRYKFCIDKIVNSTWKTSYTFNYRKDNSRGDDLSLNINLELISY